MEPTMGEIKNFLSTPKRIAAFGASTKPEKAGYYVPKYLLDRGFEIIPINPFAEDILGQTPLKSLDELDQHVDALIVYRNAEAAVKVVEEAVKKDIDWIWLPEGVISEQAKKITNDAAKTFVQDECPKALIQKWINEGIM